MYLRIPKVELSSSKKGLLTNSIDSIYSVDFLMYLFLRGFEKKNAEEAKIEKSIRKEGLETQSNIFYLFVILHVVLIAQVSHS